MTAAVVQQVEPSSLPRRQTDVLRSKLCPVSASKQQRLGLTSALISSRAPEEQDAAFRQTEPRTDGRTDGGTEGGDNDGGGVSVCLSVGLRLCGRLSVMESSALGLLLLLLHSHGFLSVHISSRTGEPDL